MQFIRNTVFCLGILWFAPLAVILMSGHKLLDVQNTSEFIDNLNVPYFIVMLIPFIGVIPTLMGTLLGLFVLKHNNHDIIAVLGTILNILALVAIIIYAVNEKCFYGCITDWNWL